MTVIGKLQRKNFSESYSEMSLRIAVKTGLRKIGLEVHRFVPASSPTAQIIASLRKFGIDLVLDVGANQGQFALELRSGGYEGNILSFEPLSAVHDQLLRASSSDPRWDVYPRTALGNHDGQIEINIAGNSVSSSILPMLDLHRNAAPESAYLGKEKVEMAMLDTLVGPYLDQSRAAFLKIDTQGYEWQVLEGAKDSLSRFQGVLLELTFVPLYEDQHLWREMIDRLEAEGFSLWAMQPGFTDAHSGQTLQADGLFFRT